MLRNQCQPKVLTKHIPSYTLFGYIYSKRFLFQSAIMTNFQKYYYSKIGLICSLKICSDLELLCELAIQLQKEKRKNHGEIQTQKARRNFSNFSCRFLNPNIFFSI